MFKHIIEFFVLFSVVGYWAQSGSPSCLICFFFRLRTHKWYFLSSLQPFRVQEFEEVQGRLFWQILWRTTTRITRNHLPDKQMTQEEDENESQICLFVYHNWSFWTISFSLVGSVTFLPNSHNLNSVSAFTSIFSHSSHIGSHFFLYITCQITPGHLQTPWGIGSSIPPRDPKKWSTHLSWQFVLWHLHWGETVLVEGNSTQGDWFYMLNHHGQWKVRFSFLLQLYCDRLCVNGWLRVQFYTSIALEKATISNLDRDQRDRRAVQQIVCPGRGREAG